MSKAKTLIDKLRSEHEIVRREDGATLLWVDRHYVHEGSFLAFTQLRNRGRSVAEPGLTFGIADHYVPTHARDRAIADPTIAAMVTDLEANTSDNNISLFGLRDPRQGIVHVVGPEQGLTLPGLLIVCGDSHTSTHGAFGAYAFGIGASEVAHVLMTQTLWQQRPKRMRVTVNGRAAAGIGAKDIALTIIARIGADGAQGHAIEFAGSAIAALSMEGRMTLCNMSIEAGARAGMVAVDETTLEYIRGRSFAPKGDLWDRAVSYWRTLKSDPGAKFDKLVRLDAATIKPQVTWGTSPEMVDTIDGRVPDPANIQDPVKRKSVERALEYMGLAPNMPIADIRIDKVFIGSCTNSRIEDLRAAAEIVNGRHVAATVKLALVVPGSGLVKRQAEAEGLDRVFRDAGFE